MGGATVKGGVTKKDKPYNDTLSKTKILFLLYKNLTLELYIMNKGYSETCLSTMKSGRLFLYRGQNQLAS